MGPELAFTFSLGLTEKPLCPVPATESAIL